MSLSYYTPIIPILSQKPCLIEHILTIFLQVTSLSDLCMQAMINSIDKDNVVDYLLVVTTINFKGSDKLKEKLKKACFKVVEKLCKELVSIKGIENL